VDEADYLKSSIQEYEMAQFSGRSSPYAPNDPADGTEATVQFSSRRNVDSSDIGTIGGCFATSFRKWYLGATHLGENIIYEKV
jgi:hypothetical protein